MKFSRQNFLSSPNHHFHQFPLISHYPIPTKTLILTFFSKFYIAHGTEKKIDVHFYLVATWIKIINDNDFEITSPEETIVIRCSSIDERNKFHLAISNCIKSVTKGKFTHEIPPKK